MAEVLVSIVLERLIYAAQFAAEGQLALFAGAADDLGKLKATFESIEALLVDAESRQVGEQSVRLWLSRLRAASYDIADLLDDWEIVSSADDQQDESSSRSSRSWITSKVCGCFLDPSPFSRRMIALSMKEIRKRLDEIADDKNKYGFSISVVGAQNQMPVVVRSERVTTSVLDESEMIFGREDDKEKMVIRLLGQSSSSNGHGNVDVVGILGIGGLGKTTLARQIYHDKRVRDHFDTFLWVCVSDVFNVIRLIKAILEQVQRQRTSLVELESLKIELGESLSGKRFLLVLDDVWNDDERKWKELGVPFSKSGVHGSRILVTTRSDKVAKIMNSTFNYKLKGLSHAVSWELFRSEAWKEGSGKKYPELENVGKEIVRECKGVPLAIKVIGSAMQSMRPSEEDWNNVLNSKIWSLKQVAVEIMPALMLTYSYLPTHLKECFAYCSVFPKDTVLNKGLLVRLWVAQGFIRCQGERELEDIGAGYFDELVARSLFQEVKEKDDGNITCKMHDMVHDLAEFIVKDEIYTFYSSNSDDKKSNQCPSINGNARHAHFTLSETVEKIRISFDGGKKLRTFILKGDFENANFDSLSQARFLRALYIRCSTALPKSILRLKHLRYLNISGAEITELPKEIGKMKQLMYLDLSDTGISELPESVILLQNLLALNLNWCGKLKKLPRGMGSMVSLRHLEMRGTDSLECLPGGLCRIISFRTLSKFIVGGEGGGCGIEELQPLNSLEGSLEIVSLERVSSREEAENAELHKKSGLRCLVLRMSADAAREGKEGVLEGLKPHPNLENVELHYLSCSRLPSWMGLMTCLSKLQLFSCPKLEWLPQHLSNTPLTQLVIHFCNRIKGIECSSSLARLEELALNGSSDFFSSGVPDLPNLKTLRIQNYANETLPEGGWERLPALQDLQIGRAVKLESLPDSIGQLKSLQRFDIWDCYALRSLPQGLQRLSLLQRLWIRGCERISFDRPSTSHVPDVRIDYETL